MKFKNLSIMVTKLRLLLKLYNTGVSQRKISKQLELSRTSVKTYLDRFIASDKTAEELTQLDDASLLSLSKGEIYRQEPDERIEILKPLLPHYAKEVKRPYVTMQLLWEEYYKEYDNNAYSYSSFKNHLKYYIKAHTYEYHNIHIPGDVLQVDFAGDPLYITDPKTGKKSSVVVLCCVLPSSGYSFVYAMINASMDNFYHGLSVCLFYIRGVPIRILSDNMKQWVNKREKDGPVFNDAALAFGAHYSTIIEATRVRKPKDKAAVEGSVHTAYQRIYAQVRDEVFFSIEELNQRILKLLDELNTRKMKNKKFSRLYYFEENEKPTLSPLPSRPFVLKYTKTSKVGSNYHIYLNTHQYSVPYNYVNQDVTIIYDKETVEIYNLKFERIAIHKRSYKRFCYSTNKSHMPTNHLKYEDRKKTRNALFYLDKAKGIDPSVEIVLHIVLENAVVNEQAFNSCEAILQLHKLDPKAFILTCKYVETNLKIVNYKIINQIMNNKIYLKDKNTTESNNQIIHKNLRGKDEYVN